MVALGNPPTNWPRSARLASIGAKIVIPLPVDSTEDAKSGTIICVTTVKIVAPREGLFVTVSLNEVGGERTRSIVWITVYIQVGYDMNV